MHYSYVLLSEKDGHFHIGMTNDLRKRFKQHAQGRVTSAAYRRPLHLAYYEACHSVDDACRRERYAVMGVEPAGSTPERAGAYLKSQTEKYAKAVKAIGLRIE